MISDRASKIKPSATLALNAKVKELIKSGEDIVNFTVGEPDFDTPDNIKDATVNALKEGFTKYTDAAGIIELKQAISDKFKNDNNLDYSTSEIIVSNGAKHSLFNTFQSILNNGDEVIIPVPYWVSYAEQVSLSGGNPVLVDTNNFQLDLDKIKEKINEKTRAVLINSPNNPTGAVFSEESMKELGELAKENNFYIISDEIYEKLIYDAKHFSVASTSRENTIIINGVSKSYSMTGWRIGYAAGPEDVIKAMSNIQSQTTGNPNSIAQKGALEALTGDQSSVEKMRKEFEKRRNFVVKRLAEIGLNVTKPQGAFYAYPKIEGSSMEVASKLLEEAKVAVVPGAEFGTDNYFRMSYATSMETLKKGLDRMEKFFK